MTRSRLVALILSMQLMALLVIIITFTNIHLLENKTVEVVGTTKIPEIFDTPHRSSEFILSKNTEQIIYNEEYGDVIDLTIVVQIHNRSRYLQNLLKSLERAPEINKTLLIFSHDLIDVTINEIIQDIKFAKVMQIFYPFSIQTHPDKFPGPDANDCQSANEILKRNCSNADFFDSFGNFRNSSLVQIKHHWWWKANFVFRDLRILENYSGPVLFLEEDHYLAPDFMHCLKLMTTFSKQFCPHCWFYSLGFHKVLSYDLFFNFIATQNSIENLGLAFNRTIWHRISKFREHFCKFDDYNWDWSLEHVLYDVMPGEKTSAVMVASRVLHIGSCGTHTNEEICNSSRLIGEFEERQANLFPDSFYFLYEGEDLRLPNNNGGWGDPRDHALCMEM